uniref:Uncharacterized protein n=1 Tax=Tanacetum cinerariifolium TaxID=118510 RepID=A0A699IE56_TANCI|nr:hypothetical protein [Tanacetum cinerariifolium]
MSTQQDIYAAGSKSRPPMLNKENYVPWSSCLLRYAKSRPNGKLIHNSILNEPYVRKMIPKPGDANREITVTETFYMHTDNELSDKPEWSRHVTIVHQTKDLHTADYTQLYDFLKYNKKEVDELKAERIAKNQDPLALMANSNNPYAFSAPHQDQSSFNQNYLQQPMPNPEDITDPITVMNMALALMAKEFKLNYSTPTNNNQRISSNPKNRQIAQPEMNMGQDRQMHMVGGNGGNQFRQYVGQNARNPAGYNDVIGNQNQIGNGNLVVARAEGNTAGQNGNQIRCCNCKGVDDELSDKELKQIEADDQAIQTVLLGLPEDIYAAVDSCETAQEIWLRVQQMMKGSEIGIQEKKAKLFNEWESQSRVDRLLSFIRLRTCTRLITLNWNLDGYNDVIGNQVIQNAIQNPMVQNVGNPNGLMGVQGNGNQNQIRNGNVVAARAEELHSQAKEKGCCLSSNTVIDCSEGRGRNLTPS